VLRPPLYYSIRYYTNAYRVETREKIKLLEIFYQIATRIRLSFWRIFCHYLELLILAWIANHYIQQVERSSKKIIGRSLKFSTFILWNSQIWLYLLMVDHNLSYHRNLTQKTFIQTRILKEGNTKTNTIVPCQIQH
jgi:hypothetical protein